MMSHDKPDNPQVADDPSVATSEFTDIRLARYSDIRFDANRCAAYHGMRMYFFEFWSKAISVFAFVSSSASIASLLSANQTNLTVFTAATAFLAGVNIIVGLGAKAKDHAIWRSKYLNFLAGLEKVGPDCDYRDQSAALQGMYAETPPYLMALDLIAWNRAANSLGMSDRQFRVPRLHRMLAHFHPFTSYYCSGKDRRPNSVEAAPDLVAVAT